MCFTVKNYVELSYNMTDIENEAANILMQLKCSNDEGTQRCQSDDDDLCGLVYSMNELSLELTKHEKNKNSCITSNAISIDETSHIIETQCSLFSNIIVDAQMLPGKTINLSIDIIKLSIDIIQRIIQMCFMIFDYSIKLADLIDRVTIVKLPFVSIGRLLVYGYWYSLIYVTIKRYPGFGKLLHAIFEKLIFIINSVNTNETFGTPNYLVYEIINDAAVQGAINAVQNSASQAAKDVGNMVYTYMINMAGKIPILLAIHQLLQLNQDNIQTINTRLEEITNNQQIVSKTIFNTLQKDHANTNLMIKNIGELKINVHDLKKITEDTNLYLQGLNNNLENTGARLGLQIDQLKGSNANIIQRLNMQDTQATTKLITDLFFAGAPKIMRLADAFGVPLPTGLLGNGNLELFGGKKRSTRRKCKRSKVYKRGSSRKRGICKNTKKRVKSKKSKKPSKRRMKNTKRK